MSDPSGPEFDFALVGTWAPISVTDEDLSQRQIREFVGAALGRSDELATLRHVMRQDLERSVKQSITANGQMLYLAKEIITGVPLLASLLICWPQLGSIPTAVAMNPHLARAFLKKMLMETNGEAQDSDLELVTGVALRRTVILPPPVQDGVDVLRVDYWLTTPDPGRFVTFSFGTALSRIQAEMTALFDAIVQSVRWDGLVVGDPDAADDGEFMYDLDISDFVPAEASQ